MTIRSVARVWMPAEPSMLVGEAMGRAIVEMQ